MSRSMILLRRRLQSADHKLAPLTQMVCGLRYARKIHVALTTICSAAFLLCILFIHDRISSSKITAASPSSTCIF